MGISDEFNKSHGIGYSCLSLQTAYLKAHYPVEFYTAVLNACASDNSKVNKNVTRAIEHNVDVLPPQINNSEIGFSIVNGKILFGLGAIKAIGTTVVEKIINERNTNGKFTGVVNLMQRVPELNTKQIVALIKSGAFGQEKGILLEKYLKHVAKGKHNAVYPDYRPVKTIPSILVLKTEYGIESNNKEERVRLFNEYKKKEHETTKYEEWKQKRKDKMQKEFNELWEKYSEDKAFWEFHALGVFLSDNPFAEVYSHIQRPFDVVNVDEEFFDVGIISHIQKKKDRNKRTYCYFNLYTYSGIIEAICFSSQYDKFLNLIAKGQKVAVYGEKSTESTFVVKNIETLDNWVRRSCIKLGS